ncbi:hypothetical protein TNIN_291521 [Trichonephila inaurata madagascariensis]|uniref:Uncharacterized protein n=1 Tax=Trichonephila inaurata madagascariensis TaxID=2747483 RepID=A0A8X7CMJ1_9ARAC|nr:hypothetical protein TNIN_291521 [Trichonephila inaurata madagascariensis]
MSKRALGNRNALDHELVFLALENIQDEVEGGIASRPVLVAPHLKALINMQKTQQSFSCATLTTNYHSGNEARIRALNQELWFHVRNMVEARMMVVLFCRNGEYQEYSRSKRKKERIGNE